MIIEEHSAPADAPAEDAIQETTPADSARLPRDQGILTVEVPAEATITVNGLATSSEGAQRRYVSKGLNRGYSYKYEVTATVDRGDGEKVERTQFATLRAGQAAHLDFDFSKSEPVETRLTLRVPENASVFLSGMKSQSTGTVREFATNKIEAGQKWSDYHVVVTVEQDGQKLTKEQDISLAGGDQLELNFDFDETKLADAR